MSGSTTPTTTTRTTDRPHLVHRLVAVLLALLTVGSALGLAAKPAAALPPGTPRVLVPLPTDHELLVAWSLPDTGGKPPTGWKLERYVQGSDTVQKSWALSGTTMSFRDETAANGVTYRYRVQVTNQDGQSWSELSDPRSPIPNEKPWFPFSSPTAFVNRMYQDFLHRAPTTSERINAANGILLGSLTPAQLIDQVASVSSRPEPKVIRLYFAFFKRASDVGGLTYWSDQIRNHGKNLNTVAQSFASMQEFKAKYGNLTNSQFVTLVYNNVLDRNPEPAGLAYWTHQLDIGAASRGQVMVGFSESSEHKNKRKGVVGATDVWETMMRTKISDNGLLVYYGPHIQLGGSEGIVGNLLFPTNSYPK